jgi:hypothetical protein
MTIIGFNIKHCRRCGLWFGLDDVFTKKFKNCPYCENKNKKDAFDLIGSLAFDTKSIKTED